MKTETQAAELEAGSCRSAGASDGRASVATFNQLPWLDVVPHDSTAYLGAKVGDVFVIDRENQAVRRISGQVVSRRPGGFVDGAGAAGLRRTGGPPHRTVLLDRGG